MAVTKIVISSRHVRALRPRFNIMDVVKALKLPISEESMHDKIACVKCPICGSTPNAFLKGNTMLIDFSTNTFNCLRCNRHGDALKLYCEVKKCDEELAVEELLSKIISDVKTLKTEV